MHQVQNIEKSHRDFLGSECEISHPMPNTPKSEYYEAFSRLKPAKLTWADWTRAAGVSTSFFQDAKKGKRPGFEKLTKALAFVEASISQYNALLSHEPPYPLVEGQALPETNVREADIPFRQRSNPMDMPVFGTTEGTHLFLDADESEYVETTTMMTHEPMDHIRRPFGLANRPDAYALFLVGVSMQPRWMDGEPVFIDPKKAPAINDHVLVQLIERDGDGDGHIVRTMVKKLVRRTADYFELEQYNPPRVFQVRRDLVATIQRVFPPDELFGI